ncbi:oxidoreductase [Irpex rosettiformis]|uniref:Oxidoreductase n=1 Tax=Irpex rosettiformis TaxID=378272 RepID=A0ACB8U8S7_9APHY|nr:oxidoreductase [Irpex rosettiformis]
MPSPSLLSTPLLGLFALCIVVFSLSAMFSRKSKWDPNGKHCYVTGGTSGLGLSLAILLAKRGAHVSIVARNQERLDKALKDLENVRQSPSQKFHGYSFAVDKAKEASAALEASTVPFDGKCPDALFLCAGKSRPGFFVEQTEELMVTTMEETYWAQAWTAFAGSKRMVKEGVQGKIVFVASLLAYFSIAGYSPYSPGKFAIRGLVEALQAEFLMYGIDIHIAFPGTIFSPGLEEENKVKPKITLKLEESDDGMEPDKIAEYLLSGVSKGMFHITYDFIGNVFRASTRGSSPGNSSLLSQIYAFIGAIALPIWRHDVDSKVRAHRDEHYAYLKEKKFL